MNYKMSQKEYFRKIIELYRDAKEPAYYNPNIRRGRSASISSEIEDLTALFIALNNPSQCTYYVDQPMIFEGTTTKYPDIVIQNEDSGIENLIDVKTDLGWNRNGMYDFCLKWNQSIESVKGTQTKFRDGKSKDIINGNFSNNLKYHIFVVSLVNSGKQVLLDYKRVLDEMENVQLYILSDGEHPNKYNVDNDVLLNKINIKSEEFDRFFKFL